MDALSGRLTVENTALGCPYCGLTLWHDEIVSGSVACSHCGRLFEATRFDPPRRLIRVAEVSQSGSDGMTSCANHQRNTAVAECTRCGLFICSLCRIDADGMVLCPACFNRLAAEGALPSARTTLRHYSGMAAVSAVAGVFLWFLAIVFGPLAIYYGIRGLKQKREMSESDGRAGLVVTMVLGGLETVGGIILILVMTGALFASL